MNTLEEIGVAALNWRAEKPWMISAEEMEDTTIHTKEKRTKQLKQHLK